MNDHLGDWFGRNPAVAKDIVRRAITAAQARIAARKARETTRRKGLLETSSMPGKLKDCSRKIRRFLRFTWWRVTLRVVRRSGS